MDMCLCEGGWLSLPTPIKLGKIAVVQVWFLLTFSFLKIYFSFLELANSLGQVQGQRPIGGVGLLLRHASQSSLDESSQKFGQKLGEHKRPPYKNVSHPGKALDGMNSMRLSGMLCDVTLVAANTEIPAHKVNAY